MEYVHFYFPLFDHFYIDISKALKIPCFMRISEAIFAGVYQHILTNTHFVQCSYSYVVYQKRRILSLSFKDFLFSLFNRYHQEIRQRYTNSFPDSEIHTTIQLLTESDTINSFSQIHA